MPMLAVVLLAAGLVVLVAGAELLIRGASRIALALHISPLIIGLTVVAFGTSAPELAVSLVSAMSGQADIAVGNVVGSNIFNVLFILGISALITPLVVNQQLIRLDVPLMIGVSGLVWFFARDGTLHRVEGSSLVAGILLYTGFLIRKSRDESREIQDEYRDEFGAHPPSGGALPVNAAFVLLGLALLVLGSRWLVSGATTLAAWFGVSQLIIGLTIVAAGTSLPEVATSILASVRGERDIAVGNVVGSNIFNLLTVLGVASAVAPGGITVPEQVLAFDIPVMAVAAVACLPIFLTGHLIARWEGGIFLLYYAAYSTYLIMAAQGNGQRDVLGDVMLYFVIPLTVLTLAVSVYRMWRSRHPGEETHTQA